MWMHGTPIVATHSFIDARIIIIIPFVVPDARRPRNALGDTPTVDVDAVGGDRVDARAPGIDAIRPGGASRRAHRR